MTESSGSTTVSLARVLIWAGGLIAFDQLTQILLAAGPAPFGSTLWRFGFASAVAPRVASLLAAGALVAGAGAIVGSDRAERVGTGLLWVAGAVALVALASLWFDGPTVRLGVGAEGLSVFVRRWARLTALAGATVVGAGLVLGLTVRARSGEESA